MTDSEEHFRKLERMYATPENGRLERRHDGSCSSPRVSS